MKIYIKRLIFLINRDVKYCDVSKTYNIICFMDFMTVNIARPSNLSKNFDLSSFYSLSIFKFVIIFDKFVELWTRLVFLSIFIIYC